MSTMIDLPIGATICAECGEVIEHKHSDHRIGCALDGSHGTAPHKAILCDDTCGHPPHGMVRFCAACWAIDKEMT